MDIATSAAELQAIKKAEKASYFIVLFGHV